MARSHVERLELDELTCWRARVGSRELLISQQGAQILSYQEDDQPPLIWLSEQAEFKQGQSVRGGVPLLAAMESGARVMDNVVMREAVTRAMDRVREGASLARALDETRLFPALLVHLVASGETSGRLEQMLERAAQLETRALERRLAVFLTLLEPLMILLMGGVVMMIVLAILLPIMEINQLVQ